MKGLIAKKVGMTQVFDESGNLIPVTVIQVEPNVVVAKKTKENCGYDAVVLGLDDMKASRASKAYAGQFPENITPKRCLKEFRDYEKEVNVGDAVGLVAAHQPCRCSHRHAHSRRSHDTQRAPVHELCAHLLHRLYRLAAHPAMEALHFTVE